MVDKLLSGSGNKPPRTASVTGVSPFSGTSFAYEMKPGLFSPSNVYKAGSTSSSSVEAMPIKQEPGTWERPLKKARTVFIDLCDSPAKGVVDKAEETGAMQALLEDAFPEEQSCSEPDVFGHSAADEA